MPIELEDNKALHSELELFKIIQRHINTSKQETIQTLKSNDELNNHFTNH